MLWGGGLLFTEAPATRPLQRWEPSSWGRYPNPRKTKPIVRRMLSCHSLKSSTLRRGPCAFMVSPPKHFCFPCSPPSLMTLWLCLPHVLLALPLPFPRLCRNPCLCCAFPCTRVSTGQSLLWQRALCWTLHLNCCHPPLCLLPTTWTTGAVGSTAGQRGLRR